MEVGAGVDATLRPKMVPNVFHFLVDDFDLDDSLGGSIESVEAAWLARLLTVALVGSYLSKEEVFADDRDWTEAVVDNPTAVLGGRFSDS